VGDNLLEDTMLSGVSTMLSKFIIPTVFCLDFLVIEFICSMDLQLFFL